MRRHCGGSCFIGACTGGRDEDIAAAAQILKEKGRAGDLLIVIPASLPGHAALHAGRTLGVLIDAGAAIATPGCGRPELPRGALRATARSCITASNRNFPGRMGKQGSAIYDWLPPASVAAAALTGRIADPAELL
jgi:3-isopropylmalate/(R)-2-methylmalate dehydratase large subunit